MKMSCPPTYEQSQTQSKSQVGDAPATPSSPVPPTPPPSVNSINEAAKPDISQSTESLHLEQPSLGNESKDQGQGELNESNASKKPWLIWCVAVEDIMVATGCATLTMVLRESKEEFHIDPVLGRKPTWADVVTIAVFARYLIQFVIGLGLLLGLLSTNTRRTLLSLQLWMLGAFFIFCQLSISFASNIINLSARYEDEATAWIIIAIVVGDFLFRVFILVHVLEFFFNLKSENSHDSQEQQPEAHELNSI